MHQPEGLQYMNTLYLNMGYYTTRILLVSQDMTTIVTKFWKFRYNSVPMDMCTSGDIFQSKVDEMLGNIKGFKKYIGGISVLSKESFSKKIEQLWIMFGRFRSAGLKSNARKCSFGIEEITYLGYVITQEGIKTDPKKFQGIMYIGRPTTNR